MAVITAARSAVERSRCEKLQLFQLLQCSSVAVDLRLTYLLVALACDILIAGEWAVFHIAEVNFGMVTPYNTIWMQLKHGSAKALEMVVGGQRYTGADLVPKGVAAMAVADASVLTTATEYSQKLAHSDSNAMRVAKAMIRSVRGAIAGVGCERIEDIAAVHGNK